MQSWKPEHVFDLCDMWDYYIYGPQTLKNQKQLPEFTSYISAFSLDSKDIDSSKHLDVSDAYTYHCVWNRDVIQG